MECPLLWIQSLILYFALVNAVVCEISCYTGPRYNGT